MRTIPLGKSGLMASEVGFGGIPIQRVTDEEAQRVLTRCLDLGVTFLDTAHGYGNSEERIGRAIKGRRDGLVIATKCPARDAATFRGQMETSFQRLGVVHIDLLQFHGVSSLEALAQVTGPGGALEAAREAWTAGRVGHIGVTSHSMETALAAVRSGFFETLMFPFNFVSDEASKELIPLCRQQGVGFIVMKSLGGGLLPHARVAFNFLRQFADLLPIPGIERCEEIEEIVGIVSSPASLTAADRAEIESVRAELGKRFCHRCDYCQPCQQNIRISMALNFRSFWRRMPAERTLASFVEVMKAVETCQDCAECESRCPYQLPIREMLKENLAVYRGLRPA